MKIKNINETIKNEFLHYDKGELDRVLSMTKEASLQLVNVEKSSV